jgi:hypothetical protein
MPAAVLGPLSSRAWPRVGDGWWRGCLLGLMGKPRPIQRQQRGDFCRPSDRAGQRGPGGNFAVRDRIRPEPVGAPRLGQIEEPDPDMLAVRRQLWAVECSRSPPRLPLDTLKMRPQREAIRPAAGERELPFCEPQQLFEAAAL